MTGSGKRFFALPLLLLLCGCFWGGSPELRTYDLICFQTAEELPWRIHYQLFRNLSGADRRLLIRDAENQVKGDEFNRWILDPELMMERYLRNAVSGDGDAVVSVRGVLTRFDIDRRENKAVLKMDFILVSRGRRKEISCSSERTFSPAGDWYPAAVSGMERCAADTAQQLRKQIKLFMEKK